MRLLIAHRVTAAIPPNKQLHPTRVPLRFTRAAVLLPIGTSSSKAAEFAIATALAFDALCDEGLEVARNQSQTNATPVKRKVTRKARQ